MNGTSLKFAVVFSILILMVISGCSLAYDDSISRTEDFNEGWKFILGDLDGAEAEVYDDAEWRTVGLPHDWAIEPFDVQDILHSGPFYKNHQGGGDVGFLRDGIAWYRKTFTLPSLKADQQVYIHFDGVQSISKCWVNGQLLGENDYGYTPFYFNITPYLNPESEQNTMAVRTENPGSNSRWYSGSGIYRQVKISILNSVSAEIWGTSITTPRVSENIAMVNLDVRIRNYSNEKRNITCGARIKGPDGSAEFVEAQEISIPAGGSATVNLKKEIKEPCLWSPEHPDLYSATIMMNEENKLLDSFDQAFGIRSISYSAAKGFLLNNEPYLLKGANMHHDNGLLGAAAYKDAEYRRVRIIKENGFNAIRTAHNIPSEIFLDACDELGMLVIDEVFDAWARAKRKNDYNVHFEKNWKKDLTAMIERDKNHPSIIMWSIGNEVPERALPSGLKIAQNLISEVKKLDTSRAVTESICNFWDNPGMTWPDAQPAFQLLDVSGYNYEWSRYENDNLDYPDRVMYGSETFPLDAWENWDKALKHPYVIGGFVWTAMDYIGEAGIGHSLYIDQDESTGPGTEWPWYVAWCGDIDILGNKKPQSYYRDVVWGNSHLEMMVHAPVPEGKKEFISRWGWRDELNSWTWPGAEGEELEIRIYTNYPNVVLKLNGDEVGSKELASEDKITALFKTSYAPGELKVVAYDHGKAMDSLSYTTAGTTDHIELKAEREMVSTENDELIFVQLKAVDEHGHWVPSDKSSLEVEVSGEGALLAAGNGSPWIPGSFTDDQFELYQGRGLIIIKPTGTPGKIGITVSGIQVPASETLVLVE